MLLSHSVCGGYVRDTGERESVDVTFCVVVV